MLAAGTVKGFEKLNKNADMFRKFLTNFYNSWGLETRETIEPISVKYVKDSEGAYLKFDYKIDGRKEWLHVTGPNTWY